MTIHEHETEVDKDSAVPVLSVPDSRVPRAPPPPCGPQGRTMAHRPLDLFRTALKS